jgi:hypothetical protein
MRKSDWYRDQAADSDRKARATTKPATRDRHINDRNGWLEIAASVDAADINQNQTKSAVLLPKAGRIPPGDDEHTLVP